MSMSYAHCKNQQIILSTLGNTLKETCFEDGIQIQCEWHSSPNHWTLTPLKEAYELQIWKLKFLQVYIPICTFLYHYYKGSTSILSSIFFNNYISLH